MPNANSVSGYAASGTIRNTFPTQTVATATETILLLNTDTGTTSALLTLPGVVATGPVVAALGSQVGLDANANTSSIDRSAREYGLPFGNSNDQFFSSSWDGRPFKVRIEGIASLGATQTAIFYLYLGATSGVGTSTNRVGNTGSAYPGGGTSLTPSNFLIEATLLWDVTSQVVSGWYTANISNGTTSQFVTTTVSTNVFTSIAASGLTFFASVKLANATSSTITVREFVIDKL